MTRAENFLEMARFFKQKLDFIAASKHRRTRARASTVLFRYIIENFDNFLLHFSNRTLIDVIYKKCEHFLNDPLLQKYTELISVCETLCSKLEKVIENDNLLKKNQ